MSVCEMGPHQMTGKSAFALGSLLVTGSQMEYSGTAFQRERVAQMLLFLCASKANS